LSGSRALVLLAPLAAVVALVGLAPRRARAFGDVGAFDPRVLLTGTQSGPAHPGAPEQWSRQMLMRTSAPARLTPEVVHADDPAVVEGPFLYWSGASDVAPLTVPEVAGLRRFFALGGILLVDSAVAEDTGAEPGPFSRNARRELARVLPDGAPVTLGTEHVVFHSFYLLRRALGRFEGKGSLDAIVRGGQAQVIFVEQDLGGALAKTATGWTFSPVPGGAAQREQAIRLAVNVAMYVLCSNYKDDQVHVRELMRRREQPGP
jgi:hypothetical protein